MTQHMPLSEKPLPPPHRICAGCPKEIPLDTPELKEVLDHSIKKFNAENNEQFYFKIDEVIEARSQVCKLFYKTKIAMIL